METTADELETKDGLLSGCGGGGGGDPAASIVGRAQQFYSLLTSSLEVGCNNCSYWSIWLDRWSSCKQLVVGITYFILQVIRRFCDRIPGINELCKPDVDLLFQTACLELFSLRLAYR